MWRILGLVLLGFLLSGCGDCAAVRNLSFSQFDTINHPSRRFEVDTSRIPQSWIEDRSIHHGNCGDSEFIKIGNHAVKIILVPADQDVPAGKPIEQAPPKE